MKKLWLLVILLLVFGLLVSSSPVGAKVKTRVLSDSSLLVEIPAGRTLDIDIPRPTQDGITYRGQGVGVSTVVLTSDSSPFIFEDIYNFHLKDFTIEVSDGHTSTVIGIKAQKRHSNWWSIDNIRITNPHNPNEQHFYTALHLEADGENRAIHSAQIRDFWAEGVGTFIKLETILDSNWIGEITFDTMWAQGYEILVDFPDTGEGVFGCVFTFVCGQSTNYSEMGYRNVGKSGNLFINPMVWDWNHHHPGEPWMRFAPGSYQNMVISPFNLTGIEDLGNNKIIHWGE